MTKKFMFAGMAGAIAVVVVAVGVIAATFGPGASPADPTDAAQVALGRTLYADNCASCHGAELKGEGDWRQRKASGALPAPPHDYSGHTWHHPDDQLFALTRDGVAPYAPEGYVSDMPGFGDRLSDDQIWAILAYIKSRWPEDIRNVQAERSAAAQGG